MSARRRMALSGVQDLEKAGVVPVLETVLKETDKESKLVRYEAAVLLGVRLGPKAPDKVLDILLENLNDRDIKIYHDGLPKQDGIQEVTEGDARWLPAMALERIGPKAKREDIMNSLKEAAQSKDEKVSKWAERALQKIQAKPAVKPERVPNMP